MDFMELISPIASALIAVFGAYAATKKAAEDREREQERRMNEYQIEVSTSIAEVKTEIRLLSDRVEKHNNVIERTTALETEVNNIYHRIGDLRG